MADKIYVVMGTTGEYSGREEWPVLGFTNAAMAQHYATWASEYAQQLDSVRFKFEGTPTKTNPYDPHMKMAYNGTSYYVMAVLMATTSHPQEGAPHA